MLTLKRRTPLQQAPESSDPAPVPDVATDVDQAQAHLAARVSTVALCAALACGPIGAAAGLWALTRPTAATAPAPIATGPSSQATAAAELGERVVAAWLSATATNPGALPALVGDLADSGTWPRKALTYRDLAAAGVTQQGQTWSVTVGATVTDIRKHPARRYYQVPVTTTPDGWAVMALPTPVPNPAITQSVPLDYRADLATASAPGQTITAFLGAYLAGSGDITPYLSPGHPLLALTPAPYRSVRVMQIQATDDIDPGQTTPVDGQHLQVLVTAQGQVTREQITTVTLPLTLTARAGRWEITQIDPAPAAASLPSQNPTTP